jgi:hypothetical protein
MVDAVNPYDAPAADGIPRITIVPEHIRIIAELTLEGQAAATAGLSRLRKTGRMLLILFLFIVAILVAMMLAFSGQAHHRPLPDAAPDPGLPPFFIFLIPIIFVVVFVSLRITTRRQQKVLKRSPFLGTRTFDLGPDHIAMHGEGYRIQVDWPLLESVAVTPEALWLLYNAYEGWWIPRSAIGGQDNLDAVIAFVRARNPETTIESGDKDRKNRDGNRPR